MSSALALASVSFVLVDLLNNGLIDRDIASTGLGEIVVTAYPPDRVDHLQKDGKSQLNLFLYNVTQNEAWRNVGFPSRDASGDRINNPPLALNLHYLLSAYGAEQYHAEILLGYGMQLLHETPFLPRDAVRHSLAGPTQVLGTPSENVPPGMLNLFTSGLADQVELIKIWPQTLTTEEISRLWTAFQAKYRPTAAYQVSVVLIQSETSTKSALPVQSRAIAAIPFNRPVITDVVPQLGTSPPSGPGLPILPGATVALVGSQLAGKITTVLIGSEEITPSPVDTTATRVIVTLPADIPAGTTSAQIVQKIALGASGESHSTVDSNVVTFDLHPVITSIALSTGRDESGNPVQLVDLGLSPAVGATQSVRLLLNQLMPPVSPPSATPTPLAYTFVAPPPYSQASPPPSLPGPTNNLSVPYKGVVSGTYLVRVEVDGVQSLLAQDANGFFTGPTVVIP